MGFLVFLAIAREVIALLSQSLAEGTHRFLAGAFCFLAPSLSCQTNQIDTAVFLREWGTLPAVLAGPTR